MSVACACAPELESYTDRSWGIGNWDEVEQSLPRGPRSELQNIPHYEYLVHLRHHGFPSPLLDWSESPYIAAFFAFEEQGKAGEVGVFAYVETPKGYKGGPVGIPEISVQGPHIHTHKRHFLQQAWYTVACEFREGKHYFVPHETVFDQCYDQDYLLKITIPMSERANALRSLYEYNITRFSLFQTEEALVRTLAFKELEEEYEFPGTAVDIGTVEKQV
jgi:hypothetical protein